MRGKRSRRDIERLLLRFTFSGQTLKDFCRKERISTSTFYRLCRSAHPWGHEAPLCLELDRWVLGSLSEGPSSVAGIINWIDHLNHMRYGEDEVTGALGRLRDAGLVRRAGSDWEQVRPWP